MQVTPGLLEGPGGRMGWRVNRDIARLFHDSSDGSEALGIFAVGTSPRQKSATFTSCYRSGWLLLLCPLPALGLGQISLPPHFPFPPTAEF